MKVGTDSIMLGSWVKPGNARRMLDVGTGSGLLALMLAQEAGAADFDIVAIDIDQAAVEQAGRNIAASLWSDKIRVFYQSLQLCEKGPFDLIISNPPYYPAGQSFDPQRQQARHQAGLNFDDLMRHVARLLADNGRFACVIPAQFERQLLNSAAQSALYLNRRLAVKSTPNKAVSRLLLEFSAQQAASADKVQLFIRNLNGEYSEDYKNLCREFYLNF
ncbi:methyltransferase [Neptunicella marina]|uniref:tRNA1(Val) (adenine(37)-N6)-methyltransferase n=2 Tax=Neptunicella marina TaxID=2125989 RepID=A0A8J6IVD0_9ALTE|nr:methyltransferase [Neptunicella marina]